MGIGKYNEECRSIVMRYAKEWETIVHRLGRWIDFEVGGRGGQATKGCAWCAPQQEWALAEGVAVGCCACRGLAAAATHVPRPPLAPLLPCRRQNDHKARGTHLEFWSALHPLQCTLKLILYLAERLQDPGPHVHGVGVVGVQAAVRQEPGVPRLQGGRAAASVSGFCIKRFIVDLQQCCLAIPVRPPGQCTAASSPAGGACCDGQLVHI